MPTLTISSPADGSAVLENSSFSVGVQWEASLDGSPSRTTSPQYTVTCSAWSVTETDPTDDMPGSTTFGFTAGPAGTTTTVNATLTDNDTGNVLASDSVTVHAVTLQEGGGSMGGGSGRSAARAPSPTVTGTVYVCGKYDAARTASLVCVTYQVGNDQSVPRDGTPNGPPFTISRRLKHVQQYSVFKGTLKLEGGTTGTKTWQATVPSNLIGQEPAPYQMAVWFLDASGKVISQVSAPLDSVYQTGPCLP